MLWLYTNPNNFITYNFYQVFVGNDNKVYNDENGTSIYSFELANTSNIFNMSKLNLNNYQPDNINIDIKIIDNIISYNTNFPNNKKKNLVFTFKTNFIEPKSNQYSSPIFNHVYKSVNPKRLPNLIETKYDLAINLNFKIYHLDKQNQIQFIIETDTITNLTKMYFVTTNLNLLQIYTN